MIARKTGRRVFGAAVVWSVLFVAGVSRAWAQDPPAALPPTDLGIKYDFTLRVSGGLDLDVFGEVLALGLNCNPDITEGPTACSNQARIIQVGKVLHYPDVYQKWPVRFTASAGFGIFQKDELIVQVSRNRSVADPDIEVGEMGSAEGVRPVRGTFTAYEDFSLEGGLRHYFKAVGRAKSYVNLLYGQRQVEAISGTFAADGSDGNLGTLRLYDKAKVKTAAVVFGVTYERGLLGMYIEAGFRWTERLVRQDDDLRALALETINNGGPRIFMPANLGLQIRF